MNKGYICICTNSGKIIRPITVYRKCRLGLRFRLVNISIGSSINYKKWMISRTYALNLNNVCYIYLRKINTDYLKIRELTLSFNLPSKLPL